MTLADKIKKLRSDAGLSQEQLGQAINVSRAAIAKWENNIGIPDIANLKALSDYFHCDFNVLLNDDLDLPVSEQDENCKTYCGKSCEECDVREDRNCPGCKKGPAAHTYNGCEIGKCCRTHHHAGCDVCGIAQHCGLRISRNTMPELLDKQIQKHRQELRMQIERQKKVGKFAWILFWLVIPSLVASVLVVKPIANKLPQLITPANILIVLATAAQAVTLLCMGKWGYRFRYAGYCLLAYAVSDACMLWLTGSTSISSLSLLVSLILTAIFVIYQYNYYLAFEEVMELVEYDLAEKWNNLWTMYKHSLFVLLGALVAAFLGLFPILVVLVVIATGVWRMVMFVLEAIYLFKSAKACAD